MSAPAEFDPGKHLRTLRGRGGDSDYLDVKWRIVWFRSRFPAGDIATEHIQLGESHAIFRATVTAINEGGEVSGRATGYGTETAKDFGDFIEKAETKAIGRALAALGFGTQFANDLDEGERIADAPVDRSGQQHRQQPPNQGTTTRTNAPSESRAEAATITDQQRRRIEAVAKERKLTHDDWKALVSAWFGVESTTELTQAEASDFEAWLKRATEDAIGRALAKAGVKWPRTPNTAQPAPGEVEAFVDSLVLESGAADG